MLIRGFNVCFLCCEPMALASGILVKKGIIMIVKNIDKYHQYARPVMADILKALKLDLEYHRAENNCMYSLDKNENEIEVLDFLGGFGASLFGHNHPDLLKIAKENYERLVPFNSQFSCRGNAAKLCEKLNLMTSRITGAEYITTLANTGTEAVEGAMKHSELSAYNRIELIRESIRKKIIGITEDYKKGEIQLSNEFNLYVQELTGLPAGTDLSKKLWAIRTLNFQNFKKLPYYICLNKSFHGKTTGSVQLTYNEDFRTPFTRIGPKVIFIDPENRESLKKAIEKSVVEYFQPVIDEAGQLQLEKSRFINISAMFIEPLQGEGGINLISDDFLAYCRESATRHGFHLVFDEIQCGMGRTGTFFCSEQSKIRADYYLLGKSLGGGLSKISALIVDKDLYEQDFGMLHTSTFAEDDHSSAIALKGLELLDSVPEIMENCTLRSKQLKKGLKAINKKFPGVIRDIRGKGLMLGVKLEPQHNKGTENILDSISQSDLLCPIIAGYLLNEHKIRVAPTLSGNDTIRLEPSAYISEDECKQFLKAFMRLCEILYKQNTYELVKYIVDCEIPDDTSSITDYRKVLQPVKEDQTGRKVAFIGHLIEGKHLKYRDASFKMLSDDKCDEFLYRTYNFITPQVEGSKVIKSITGEKVNLYFIGLPMDSKIIGYHMLSGDIEPVHDKIEKAVSLAIDLGCQTVGFGGFSSIVTRNCQSIITDSISLTTGNSFTVAMGIEAIKKASAKMEIDMSGACLAAIGAGGNICSVYSEIMAETVPEIILIGREGGSWARLKEVASSIFLNGFSDILVCHAGYNGNADYSNLSGVAREICETKTVKSLIDTFHKIDKPGEWLFENLNKEMKDKVPVKISTNTDNIKKGNLIIGSSNSVAPIIFPEMLGDIPVVINDIAVPNDVDDSVLEQRPDVFVIQGGIVKLPGDSMLTISGIPLDVGHSFACMAETTLLGLTDITENFSYGRISKTQVKKIMDISRIHGYSLGDYKTQRSF